MKMRDQVNRYLEYRRPALSPATYKDVESNLLRFATAWDSTRRVAGSINEDWMVDYLAEFRLGKHGRGGMLAASTFNKAIERYNHFVHWLVRRGVADARVLDALQKAIDDAPKEHLQLPMAKVVHMIQSCEDPWERWVLALASQTLGRDSELRGRCVRHMHIDTMELEWYRLKASKDKKMDRLPISNELASEWQRWTYHYQQACGSLEPNWPLVPRRTGRPGRWGYEPDASPARGLAQIVQKHAARAAGLPQETLKGQGVHIMRRSMARALYERLVTVGHPEPLRVVRAQLGHADSKTTRIYIGLEPDREERNELLAGASLLWVAQDNVVQLRTAQ